MKNVIDKAREERKTNVGLNVPRGNLPAVALFRSQGFVVRRERDGVLTMQVEL